MPSPVTVVHLASQLCSPRPFLVILSPCIGIFAANTFSLVGTYQAWLADINFSIKIGISATRQIQLMYAQNNPYFSRNPGPRVQLQLVRRWVINTGLTVNSVGEDRMRVSDASYGQLIDNVSLHAFLKGSNLSWY